MIPRLKPYINHKELLAAIIPSIGAIPKFEKAALEWRTKYLAAKKVATFENDFKYGSVLNYTDTDYKKLSNDMFAQKVAFYKSQGASDGAATMAAFQELMPFLGKNKPIKAGFFSCFKNNLLLPKFLLLAKSSANIDIATFIKSKAIIVSMGTKSLVGNSDIAIG